MTLSKEHAKDKEHIEKQADAGMCILFFAGAILCAIGITEIIRQNIGDGITVFVCGICVYAAQMLMIPFCFIAEINVERAIAAKYCGNCGHVIEEVTLDE